VALTYVEARLPTYRKPALFGVGRALFFHIYQLKASSFFPRTSTQAFRHELFWEFIYAKDS
jgi:hypothetical protein